MLENRTRIEKLISEEEIAKRVRELAAEIAADYPEQSITLLGILGGAATLTVDLGRELWKLGMHNVIEDYMAIESYGAGTESNGAPRITKDSKLPITGKHVILVEDIVDSGWSLKALRELLDTRGAASLAVLSLLSKPERREADVEIDYLGFTITNQYVVGYGLDGDEQYRNMPFIGVLVADDSQTA